MTIYPDLPYLHALGDGGPRPTTQVVVIHATDNTASAHDEASYATHRSDKTSAHFYSDEAATYQGLDTARIAYGCLYHGNRISIQFELCGLSNHLTDATMRQVAPLVARVCRDWAIPVRKVSAADVRNGVKGICGHADITVAFPEDGGDHTDPGSAFPWPTFLNYVGAPMTDPEHTPDPNLGVPIEDAYAADRAVTYGVLLGDDPVTNLPWQGKMGEAPNVLHRKLDALKEQIAALAGQSGVTLTDAQVAALGQQLAAAIPSAADIADEFARRLGNG